MPERDRATDLADLESLFHRALDLDDAGRRRLTEEVRGRDSGLAESLEQLLAANAEPDARLAVDGAPQGAVFEALEGPAIDVDRPIGPSRLIEPLGEGGMATVYRAVREGADFHQQVALKILKGGHVTPEGLARFASERRIVAALDHPNIARLIDGGLTPDGHPFVALELVEGEAIDRYCDERSLSLEERLRLAIDIGKALHYAHQNLVVHRDLKPSNILVDQGGRVRLLDFGIAKELSSDATTADLTQAGRRPMTPLYASPEQLTGGQITTLSDQYQLGLLLFELVTGQCHHLLGGNDPKSILERASELDTPRPSNVLASRTTVTGRTTRETTDRVAELRRTTVRELVLDTRGDLDWIVLKSLQKDPAQRYPSVAALVADLERLLDGLPISAHPPSLLYQTRKWIGRHRAQTALGMALVLALTAFGVLSQVQSRRADRLRAFSQRVERETEQIERLLRDASLQPLHDVTPEREAVKTRIARIRQEAAAEPELLGAAADYGVGRGLLALGETESAAEALLASWNGGFRGDGVRYALGAALGEIFRQRLRAAQAIDDEALRAERIRDAETELRDRALQHLGAVEQEDRAELRAALIAFYEGDYDEALARVEQVRSDYPWQHEALAMQAAILSERAEQLFLLGDAERARVDLERARLILVEALEVGRSDALLYLRQCELSATAIRMGGARARELAPEVAEASKSCDRASAVRPDWAEPYVALANLYLGWWDVGRSQLEDPQALVAPMRAAAERALELDPTHAEAHHRLGLAWYMDGRELSLLGKNPLTEFGRAVESLERAIGLDPGYPYSYNGLALAGIESAVWRIRTGEPPGAFLEIGRTNARRAVELMPTWHNSRSNLAWSYAIEGDWASFSGADPEPHYRQAIAEADQALTVNPEFAAVRRLRTLFLLHLAAARLERGLAATEEIAETRSQIAILLEALPGDAIVRIAAIRAELLDLWTADPSESSPELLAAARRHIEIGQEAFPSFLFFATLSIELDLIDAQRAFAAGRSPAASLGRAEATARRVAHRDPWDPILDKAVAATRRARAAWTLAEGGDPRPAIEGGLEAADRGLARNRRHWGVATERAALTLLAALEHGRDPVRIERAKEGLRDILERNAPVEPTVRPLMRVAEGLENRTLSREEAISRLFLFRSSFPRR